MGKTQEDLNKIKPLAQAMGVAAEKLWSIYVREYIVLGLSQLMAALFACVCAWVIYNKSNFHEAWTFVPVCVAFLFAYSAIQYLGNPHYHAIDDVARRIKDASY